MKTITHALAAIAEAGSLGPDRARERYLEALDIILMIHKNRESDEARELLRNVIAFLAARIAG